jgi:hypothetical protein
VETAKDWTYYEGILAAKLQNQKGEWVSDVIKVSPETSLKNVDGKFKKGKKVKLRELKELPSGDYMKDARNVQHKDNVLKGEIEDEEGQWKPFEFKNIRQRDSLLRL